MPNFTWKTVFKYRNLIYGLAAVWILVYHIYDQLWLSIPVASKIIGTGNMAVDVFLVLSAVGLSYSVILGCKFFCYFSCYVSYIPCYKFI